jgi:hypothetical protein
VEQQQELLVQRRSRIERIWGSQSARRWGFLELEENRLTCLLASIAIRQTHGSATRSLAIHRVIDPALEGIAEQTGYQPTQRNMLLLSKSTEVAKQIVGQDNADFRIGFQDIHYLVINGAVW